MTGNKIWARVGVSFYMTEEEEMMLKNAPENERDAIFEQIVLNAFKSGAAKLDGEVYSPGDYNASVNPLGVELNTDLGGIWLKSISK